MQARNCLLAPPNEKLRNLRIRGLREVQHGWRRGREAIGVLTALW